MKNYKKVLALLLAGAMTASLAACGGGGGTADSTGGGDSSGGDSSGKTQITVWHAMGGVNGEAMQEMVDDFNASQDEVEVSIEYQGTYDDTITKLKAAMQSGELPDVCQMYDVGTKFMSDSGMIIR